VRQSDGKVVAAGSFRKANGFPRANLARFDASAGLDPAFDPSPNGSVTSVAVSGTALYVAGTSARSAASRDRRLSS